LSRHVAELERSPGVQLVKQAARTFRLIESATVTRSKPGDEQPFPDVRGFARVDPSVAEQ
jgi:hypothetical protein